MNIRIPKGEQEFYFLPSDEQEVKGQKPNYLFKIGLGLISFLILCIFLFREPFRAENIEIKMTENMEVPAILLEESVIVDESPNNIYLIIFPGIFVLFLIYCVISAK